MNLSQQVLLFDRKFVTNALRSHYRCPQCKNEFVHNFQMFYGDSHVKSNRPFLLPCGHNMCENCIYQNHSNLTCNVCLRPVEIPMGSGANRSQFYVKDFFDMNFFLLGAINFFFYNRRNASSNASLKANQVFGQSSQQVAVVQKCNECENSPAKGLCKQCKVHFCQLCFESVHKNGKVLQRHRWEREEKSPQKAHMHKPRTCFRHHKVCDRFCRHCREICCAQCIKVSHANHMWSTISEENDEVKHDVDILLESIRTSRESLKKAQKDVTSTEKQLDEYATQTLHDISKYFLKLHSFLQLEERRILDEFNKLARRPQERLHEVYLKLSETQNALNIMRSNIEYYQREPPTDILLRDVVATTSRQLELLPCQVLISKDNLTQNPFRFHVHKDFFQEFPQYIIYEYEDPQLNIRIGPIYGDLNRSVHGTTPPLGELTLNTENHKKPNKRNQKKKQTAPNLGKQCSPTLVTNSSLFDLPPPMTNNSNGMHPLEPVVAATSPNADECLARISHVNTPEHFYIQQKDLVLQIKELSNKYVNLSLPGSVSKDIHEGSYYMAYRAEDKMWYRAMIKNILAKDVYKMFLVDVGMYVEMPRQRLCDIDESSLAIPHAAIRCALHDLKPVDGNTWSERANQLLVEITNNKPVRVSIIERIKNNIWKVDLITTHTSEPISVRDSFLYTGLAQERPGALNFKLQPKKMAPVARINQRLQKHCHQEGEMLTVQISHVEDPQEFFVTKVDQRASKKLMWDELNLCGEELEKDPLFLVSLQMCCALKLRDAWHRACVEEIKEGGKVRVRLVDEGFQEIVMWNQLCVLPNKFRKYKEFAIKCALVDIEPLQKNNYSWTDDAIKLFKQLCSNPTLQLFIYAAKRGEHKVGLHVSRQHMDINIGALLAKRGYGQSTGEATQVVEIVKAPNSAIETNAKVSTASSSAAELSGVKILKRTPVVVYHVKSPGEFYVLLKDVEKGIRTFHRQIQESEAKRRQNEDNASDMQTDYKDWFLGDHCIVHTNYKVSEKHTSANDCEDFEYYRGIIVSIELEPDPQAPFVVLLRDVGATVRGVRKSQLYPIDAQLDRVTNAVQRCHLACVQPTGGMTDWSQTSIDCFKRHLQKFRNLSITLQGERPPNCKSLPVSLWGMTTETADPLAPSIAKYVNINRILVNAGLAHLVERLDVTKQMDRIMQLELQEGEISIEEWFSKFEEKNKALKLVEHQRDAASEGKQNATDDELRLDLLCDQEQDNSSGSGQPEREFLSPNVNAADLAWIHSRPITKSIFTAYPTNVDFDAVIYMHDAADHALLKQLKIKIQKTYAGKTVPKEQEVKYEAGTPCLACFHMDQLLYRAVVRRVFPSDEYEVFFIDYGNVERCHKTELRPFAPFRKLPSLACKYRIEGIRPKNDEASFETKVLDILHAIVVGKFVSVRVPTSEMHKEIKACSIRVGSEDVAEMLLRQGLVDSEQRPSSRSNESKSWTKNWRRQNMHPVQIHDDEGDSLAYPATDNVALPKTEPLRNLLFADIEKCLSASQRQSVEDFNMDVEANNSARVPANFDECNSEDELDEHFNAYLSQLCEDELEVGSDIFTNIKDTLKASEPHMHTASPPSKKRIFDLDEYRKMQARMYKEKVYAPSKYCDANLDATIFQAEVDDLAVDDSKCIEDQDIVELEYSFASNYWHSADADDEVGVKADKKRCRHVVQKEDPSASSNNDLECLSFDKFQPYETSSVFTHISGIDFFKEPQLPTGIRGFFCKVEIIITPVILHIFPHLAELEYRENELKRRIQHLVKRSPSLIKAEPNAACLACYSKDKKWYRAVIRSYNPAAKSADVIYVDYLNTETLPLKCLRQYPMELASWPLRTFRMRLAGLQPNPRMREKDVRRALHNVIRERTLYAHIQKQPEEADKAEEIVSDRAPAEGMPEIALYESKMSWKASMVIYEELILENFYYRI